jgi:hypothetical protein
MDKRWTKNGQMMDRKWTKNGQKMDKKWIIHFFLKNGLTSPFFGSTFRKNWLSIFSWIENGQQVNIFIYSTNIQISGDS